MLKDERYFDSFSRSLYITTKSHDCDEVLDSDYTNTEYIELFEKQTSFYVLSVKHIFVN